MVERPWCMKGSYNQRRTVRVPSRDARCRVPSLAETPPSNPSKPAVSWPPYSMLASSPYGFELAISPLNRVPR